MNPLLNEFSPELVLFNPNSIKKTSPWNNLVFMIDTSSSTNNNYGRGGRRNQEENESNKTKCILIAEMEGVAHTMALLANEFNFENTIVTIVSFSTESHMINISDVNSQKLYNIAKELKEYIAPSFNSTCTLKALKETFKTEYASTLLVLATDGQPNDDVPEGDAKGAVISYMNTLGQEFVEKNNRLDMLILGAGSIMTSAGIISSRVVGRNDPLRGNYNGLESTHNNECDLIFLHKLVDTSKGIGAYLPCYGDYTELKESTYQFVELVKDDINIILPWKVKLDTSITPLDNNVSTMLNNLTIGEAFVTNTQYGPYMFKKTSNTLGYQLALEQFIKLDNKIEKVISEKNMKFTEFLPLYSTTFNEIPVISTQNYNINVILTNDKYVRIREIIC